MKLKIFKKDYLVDSEEGADLVAILSIASKFATEENRFFYPYFEACENDKSLNSSYGDKFVLGLFEVFNKLLEKGGYRFEFEPYLVMRTKRDMALYLSHVHDWHEQILIEVKKDNEKIGQRFLFDSNANMDFNSIKLFDNVSNKVLDIANDLLDSPPLGPAAKDDTGSLGPFLSDETVIVPIINEVTDLLIRKLAAIYNTTYVDSDKEEEMKAVFVDHEAEED